MAQTGVYPVLNNIFKIGTSGLQSTTDQMVPIKDLTTFSVSFDNNVEEWTPMDQEGWVRRLMTGKGIKISLSGKRCVGDAGNDYVAGLAFKSGQDVETKFEWTFPSGLNVEFNAVVNLTNVGGGEATDAAPLEFEVMTNGKPTVTEA